MRNHCFFLSIASTAMGIERTPPVPPPRQQQRQRPMGLSGGSVWGSPDAPAAVAAPAAASATTITSMEDNEAEQQQQQQFSSSRSEFGSSADAIAMAVHHAREEDASSLDKIRSDKSPSVLGPVAQESAQPTFKHYVIPKSWMMTVLSYLSSDHPSDRDRPGKIENGPLLAATDTNISDIVQSAVAATETTAATTSMLPDNVANGSDADDELLRDKQRQARMAKWRQKTNKRSNRPLRSTAVHNVDYVLVGQSLWTIISSKFGYDFAIEATLRVQSGWHQNKLTVDVLLDGGAVTSIEVPSDGKWHYGTLDDKMTRRTSMTATAAATSGGNAQDGMEAEDLFSSDTYGDPITYGEPIDLPETADSSLPPLGSASASVASSQHDTAAAVGVAPIDEEAPVILLGPSMTLTTTTTNADVANPIEMDYEKEGGGEDAAPHKGTVDKPRRRYGKGLGNLGNTCFMNSSLQCLAHTAPLRQYFVSGEYMNDLNRDNPLGTGGNLTTEFANLLKQMWGVETTSSIGGGGSGGLYNGGSGGYYSSSYSSAVYPRQFKNTLGQYAEQFMGYDQHDSQELATYLLDALHEDTNRITKKPYVEKPEKKEDETDDEAAKRAWDAHLMREDSRILESFVGQGKQRLQCPRPDCGKVSTTFDPVMFLSVPIPGATDRTMTVTYVPLDPSRRMMKLSITLSKTANMAGLKAKVVEAITKVDKKSGMAVGDGDNDDDVKALSGDGMCLADVFQNTVWGWYDNPDDAIERIRESDVTFAYEVRSVASIHEEMESVMETTKESSSSSTRVAKKSKGNRRDFILDSDTISRFDKDNEEWMNALSSYCKNSLYANRMFNKSRSSHEDRMEFNKKLRNTIKSLRRCPDSVVEAEEVPVETMRSAVKPMSEEREVTDGDFDEACACSGDSDDDDISIDEGGASLEEKIAINSNFKGITTAKDLAVFELCASKFDQYASELEAEKKEDYKDGVVIQVHFNKQQASSSRFTPAPTKDAFATPLVLRISPVLTVNGLRQVLADRLSRALNLDTREDRNGLATSATAAMLIEDDAVMSSGDASLNDGLLKDPVDSTKSSPPAIVEEDDKSASIKKSSWTHEGSTPFDILRQIPLTYVKRSNSAMGRSNASSYRKLGSLMKQEEGHISTHANTFASPSDSGENDIVADLVGHHGEVHLHWPAGLSDNCFDCKEWESTDDMPLASDTANAGKKENDVTTVMDCVSKYCQKEQLEESEMYYCSRCKDHVRAWKEERIYRAPPILVIHLKRFQYSAVTHRRNKIDTFIDFPLVGLDLSEYVMHWNEGQEPIYDLYAVSNHFGGLGGGHYTAYALSDDGDWCNFDDSRVTTDVSEKDVVTSAAYCLYYRRRDVPKEVDDIIEAEVAPESSHEDDSTIPMQATTSIPASSFLANAMNANVDDDMSLGSNRSSRTASDSIGNDSISNIYGNDDNQAETMDSFSGNDNIYGPPLQ